MEDIDNLLGNKALYNNRPNFLQVLNMKLGRVRPFSNELIIEVLLLKDLAFNNLKS